MEGAPLKRFAQYNERRGKTVGMRWTDCRLGLGLGLAESPKAEPQKPRRKLGRKQKQKQKKNPPKNPANSNLRDFFSSYPAVHVLVFFRRPSQLGDETLHKGTGPGVGSRSQHASGPIVLREI